MSPESAKPSELLDVLIVGGGLSGLMVAYQLQQQHPSLSWRLLEARPNFGGRLMNDSSNLKIDLGGAWIWPFQQPHMKELTSTLQVSTFPQPDDYTSTRIEGGAVEYIHLLSDALPKDLIQVNSPVFKCSLASNNVVRVETACSVETYLARRVVFAVPPRLIAKHITFDPPLSPKKQAAIQANHTWMAGVTKVALIYENRFWDEDSSNIGFPSLSPAFQVYDSSTKDEGVSALTFFTLADTDNDTELASACARQIQNMWSHKPFANKATEFFNYELQRWPKETYISEDANPSRIHPHPHPVRELAQSEWNGLLLFAGSESDLSSPGVMEGAVGAALRVTQELKEQLVVQARVVNSNLG